MANPRMIIKDTAAIRAKLLTIWQQIDEKSITSSEARLHISVARAILDTLKVEMMAAHLAQSQIPPVSLGSSKAVAMLREQ